MSIHMQSDGLRVDTKIPIWAIVVCIFTAGGGWYLIQQNTADISKFNTAVVELSKSVSTLNETIVRMDERDKNESQLLKETALRSVENEKKNVDQDRRLDHIERIVLK